MHHSQFACIVEATMGDIRELWLPRKEQHIEELRGMHRG
jgi:hypothetical protein